MTNKLSDEIMKLVDQNILVINGGSSSIKFAIYNNGDNPDQIISGQVNRIGLDSPEFNVTNNITKQKNKTKIDVSDSRTAAEFLIGWLKEQKYFDKINCIGHRIVHGMEHTHAEIIDDKLLKELNSISDYDPDHLPSEIEIIELFRIQFPNLIQVACFDTSFHAGMPRVAKILPVPRRFDKAGVRRYGFHGLSYTYLMEALKNSRGTGESNGRIILAHLGSGASLAAIKDGASIDTTMGFTPAGGLVMGTRPGDIDPGVAWYIMQSEKLNAEKFNHLINHEAGLLGISETSSDMQDLLQNQSSDIRASEAVELFCYQIKKWIGAFVAVLNGLDTLIFSGGIGENAPEIRSRICEGFDYLNICIDEENNNKNATIISTPGSKIKVYVIPTNEEIIIAKETRKLFLNIKV